ncbi:MAG: Type 1 glutamine amidotransferase-like domain-containing protein [Anaerolineales bacterium]
MKKSALLLLLVSSFLFLSQARAQTTPGLLIPIGGGYADIYAGFSQAAVANARDGQVNLLVLAPTYSSNAIQISQAERETNIKDAEERRFQIEEACKRAAPPHLTCKAVLAPIFTRSDAFEPTHLSLFADNLAAVFLLGGDQTVAMQVLAGTPAEARLTELHRAGTIIAGTSAGGGLQSRAMLAGYNENYARETSLFFGAADVWNTDEKHGLPFGLQTAILDQHFHQRARFGRLLNAILQPGVPHIGVGVDAYTGVIAQDEILSGVFGLYTVSVLDAQTYHTADGLRYVTVAENRPPLLSARNILVSLLSPGDSAYDLKTRTGQVGNQAYPAPQTLERSFDSLSLPPGAGALLLSGDISGTLENNLILKRFIELTGGPNANLLVIADGGASASANERTAQRYADALTKLGAAATVGNADTASQSVTGFVLVGRDASKMTPPEWLREPWLAGKPILADNAAATLLGSFYAAHPPGPTEGEEAEAANQQSFWQGKTDIRPGVGLINLTLQPQMLDNNRFGRLFSLAYNHPDQLAIGLNANTALEITSAGARVLGENGIFVLDLRSAQLGLGSNNGFVIFNGLLDVFAPGEMVQPEPADVNAIYTPQPTPALSTTKPTALPSPTNAPTLPPTSAPTHTALVPKTTATPAPIVQPPASALPQLWGIGLGLLLILGAWLWSKLKHRN